MAFVVVGTSALRRMKLFDIGHLFVRVHIHASQAIESRGRQVCSLYDMETRADLNWSCTMHRIGAADYCMSAPRCRNIFEKDLLDVRHGF